jgi:nitrogen regulatory protein PII
VTPVKLIRCTVRPDEVDALIDALEPLDVLNLTVTGGGERPRQRTTGVYRGCQYKIRIVPTSVVDITASNDVVEDVVRAITHLSHVGLDSNDGRILVMPVEEWYTVRATHQRIA